MEESRPTSSSSTSSSPTELSASATCWKQAARSVSSSRSCVSSEPGVSVSGACIRHFSKSDFLPRRSFPLSERDGGYGLFSCWKKVPTSISLSWATMYSCEKRLTSAFKVAILPACFDFSFGVGHLKSGREFFLMGSWIDRVQSTKTDWRYSSYWLFPSFSTVRTVLVTDSFITSQVSSINSSAVSFMKGLPISLIVLARLKTCPLKLCWVDRPSSWW